MKLHTVKQGECISSIAEENGFFWETIWNHPDNKQLHDLRQDPNILYPGDVVLIPDKRLKELSEPTNQVYKYRLKNTPAKLKVRILRDAEPRSGETYMLSIDKVEIKRGTIPSSGDIEIPILPQAKEGKLVIGEGENAEEYILNLGYLDPIDTISGVKARLNSIGFDCGKVNNEMDEETTEAITDFQSYINHPNPNGELDDQTRKALAKLHDETAP
jgi:N-acetylmuramoyl-L-alanine amidase